MWGICTEIDKGVSSSKKKTQNCVFFFKIFKVHLSIFSITVDISDLLISFFFSFHPFFLFSFLFCSLSSLTSYNSRTTTTLSTKTHTPSAISLPFYSRLQQVLQPSLFLYRIFRKRLSKFL